MAAPPRASRAPRLSALFVSPRYGEGVVGGAERLCRIVAERLAPEIDLTVLTTCAIDHRTWRNVLAPGAETIGGVHVLRFPTLVPRLRRSSGLLREAALALHRAGPLARGLEALWLRAQGPYAPRLVREIALRAPAVDAVVFFTAIYHPTLVGVRRAAGRAVVVPTAHDEPVFFAHAVGDALRRARALIALTPEEAALIAARIAPARVPIRVIGTSVGAPPAAAAGAPPLVDAPTIVTLGRHKNGFERIPALWRAFRAAFGDARFEDEAGRAFFGRDLRWLLLGDAAHPADPAAGLVSLGVVDEPTKGRALAHALALVNPSRYESLSLALLEAWAAGRPVLANGACAPMAGQVGRSGGGLLFESDDAFARALAELLASPARRRALGEAGRVHQQAEHDGDAIARAYAAVIASARGGAPD